MAARATITYDDGTEKVVNVNRPKLLYRFEIEHKKAQPDRWAEVCWLAWQASGDADDGRTLDEWLDDVESIEVDNPQPEDGPGK